MNLMAAIDLIIIGGFFLLFVIWLLKRGSRSDETLTRCDKCLRYCVKEKQCWYCEENKDT